MGGAIPDLPNTFHKVMLNKALRQMHSYNKVQMLSHARAFVCVCEVLWESKLWKTQHFAHSSYGHFDFDNEFRG